MRARDSGKLKQQLRTAAKTGIAAALRWTGVGNLAGAWRGLHGQPLVIGYHRVVADFAASDPSSISPMLISKQTFERQLDWLGQRYRFVTLDELATTLEHPGSTGRRVAAVTFDDGYEDVYQHAMPVLLRKNIPFAVFVVTDLVGTRRLQIHDELYLLLSELLCQPQLTRQSLLQEVANESLAPDDAARRLASGLSGMPDAFAGTRFVLECVNQEAIRGLLRSLRSRLGLDEARTRDLHSLDWDMLREMSARGVTIGSHTRSHPLLTNEATGTVHREVAESRRELEQRLRTEVRHFAYPDGRFDDQVVRVVSAAGYRTACTTCRHRDTRYPLLTIPRKLLWENSCMDWAGRFSPSIFHCQVNGIFDPADACRLQHGANRVLLTV